MKIEGKVSTIIFRNETNGWTVFLLKLDKDYITCVGETENLEVEDAIDKSLSKFEKQVLNRYIKGESYIVIANKLEAPVKSVDNAIQRIRKKEITNLFK